MLFHIETYYFEVFRLESHDFRAACHISGLPALEANLGELGDEGLCQETRC